MSDQDSWYNQDKFWKLFKPFMFNKERQSSAKDEIHNIIKLLKINKGDKILDLCCGIGRHSLELSCHGFDVIGVDRTSNFIKNAIQKAKHKDLNVEFIVRDMREYCVTNSFNIVINMFGSFGYFDNPSDDLKVVKNMHASLRSGGKFLIETMGKEILAKEFKEKNWFEEGDTLDSF